MLPLLSADLSVFMCVTLPVLADRDNPILLRDQHRRVHAVAVALDLVEQDGSGALGPRVDLRRHDSLCTTIPRESAERSGGSTTTARVTVTLRENAHVKHQHCVKARG